MALKIIVINPLQKTAFRLSQVIRILVSHITELGFQIGLGNLQRNVEDLIQVPM